MTLPQAVEDMILEDIMATSEEELRQECIGDGVDFDAEVSKMRDIAKRAINKGIENE